MIYNLGIDIGIASVGFAGVDMENNKIEFAGVHIFDAAENPKDRSSLAVPRREARGQRRVIERRALRKQKIRKLLSKYGLPSASVQGSKKDELSVWQLRADALDRKLNDEEFARVLFHIAKRRGYQTNRKDKIDDSDKSNENKKVIQGIRNFKEKIAEEGFRTAGEYLATLPKKRNGDDSYDRMVERDLLREEVRLIFEKQKSFGNKRAIDKFLEEYEDSAFSQRPLKSFADKVGHCIFTGEKRAAKNSPTAEFFVAWSKLNNLKIVSFDGKSRFLTLEEKKKIFDFALDLKGGVTYKKIRKELNLDDESRFNISYRKTKDNQDNWEKVRDNTEKTAFIVLKGYHGLKNALSKGDETSWQDYFENNRDKIDKAAEILSFINDEKEITENLTQAGFNEEEITELLKITNFSKTVDLSLTALNKILPFMTEGKFYSEACELAGYDFRLGKENEKGNKIPPLPDLRNPVVNRSLAQTRKVINACISKHGMPNNIIIEMARDVGKSKRDRDNLDRENKKNEQYKETAKKHVEEIIGREAKPHDILKYRLWQEQGERCPYSGKYIAPEMLKDETMLEVDHILPYSRTYDNSYMNKVLCLKDENQKKQGRTPYEYMSKEQWEELEKFLIANNLPKKKRENLLKKELSRDSEQGFKERNLNDTKYIARELKNHIERNLNLGKGRRVQTRNGSLTARLRGGWGFPDYKRINDRHHAIDAIVLACSTESMVQKFTLWNKREAKIKGEFNPPKPWDNFRNDVKDIVYGENFFVSRMPDYKMTGAAHLETIRSIREKEDGTRQIVQRIKLTDITKSNLENMVDKERNRVLYEVLKERLEQHKWDAKKAFAEPIYMPTKNPEKEPPRINGIRIITNNKSGIEINQGLADNGEMLRTDVFVKRGKKDKFYLCPVYVHHMAEGKLPNKLIVQGKTENEWIEIDDSFEFLFSLHKNDLVKIKSKKEDFFGYFVGTDRANAQIVIKSHDNNKIFLKKGKEVAEKNFGVQNLVAFEKYRVDYFGNKYKVKKEVRCELEKHTDTKPCQS